MLIKSVLKKYNRIKEEYNLGNYILCMQSGIFFKIIGNDAVELSNKLGLKFKKDEGTNHIGFPTNALEKYVGRIVMKQKLKTDYKNGKITLPKVSESISSSISFFDFGDTDYIKKELLSEFKLC